MAGECDLFEVVFWLVALTRFGPCGFVCGFLVAELVEGERVWSGCSSPDVLGAILNVSLFLGLGTGGVLAGCLDLIWAQEEFEQALFSCFGHRRSVSTNACWFTTGTPRFVVGGQSVWFYMLDRHQFGKFLPRFVCQSAGTLINIYVCDMVWSKPLIFKFVPCLCLLEHVPLQHLISNSKWAHRLSSLHLILTLLLFLSMFDVFVNTRK